MKQLSLRSSVGGSIIEILVALAVVGLVLTAITFSLSFSVKNSAQAEYRQIATRYAQEYIEILRLERSRLGWSDFSRDLDGANNHCFASNQNPDLTALATGTNCDVAHANPPITFNRTFAGELVDDEANVTVTVTWDDGGQPRSVTVQQRFREI